MTGKRPTLKSLVVLDRLTVGPVRLEKDRLVCPYTVSAGNTAESFDHTFRYGEPVFSPGEPADENLAAMIAAQVALNYGLFARDIVFHGPFDTRDQKFLADMMENTSREIAVHKIFSPNPFLNEGYRDIAPEVRERYTAAALRFPDALPEARPAPAQGWTSYSERHLVLSSGGKDSLLTFGLLREVNAEAHAVFGNESGKHWFTALNGFRGLSAAHPETTRVWMNSDRLFSFMLRRLPFIREDFLSVRSDEYPLRLWTVAVFLFGTLPLARKRGLGRVLVGDEYDTTVRGSFHGITHYHGLYDQSLYFDRALTRYFRGKGWGVEQFSALRSLSEMLIEKILAERYPDLLAMQVSCHAAHMDGDRVRPCGKCEKCRRIVAMLLAIGSDPSALGYDAAQIERCLKQVQEEGVHQERDGAALLHARLQSRGVIAGEAPGLPPAREDSPALKIRLDPERSPVTVLPRDLRMPFYKIFLRHAEGSVRREQRTWVPTDPLKDPDMKKSDATAKHQPAAGTNGQKARPTSRHVWGELTWPQAKQTLKKVDVALLPVGAVEQHGPHLPLDTDAWDADYLAREVAKACTDPRPLVLPLIPYGVSYHHEDFAGTISVGPDTLSRMVYEVGVSVARYGIKKLIIINGHGGNGPALHFAAQLINRDAHIFTCVDTGETSDHDINAMADTPNDVHAGEVETSTTLATRPELVDMSQAKKFVPRFNNRYLDFTTKHSVGWYARTAKISADGVMGDPTKADAEKGRKMWEVMIRHLVELVEDIKGLPLTQIYEQKH